jgi:DNA-directed RNA polymerase subunit M/transcription elongation factor TFIIS
MGLQFCQVCNYYLYLAASSDGNSLVLQCRHCGYNEAMEPKSAEDALVLETTFKATGTTAGLGASGVTVNSYTLADPTLPHTATLECPNSTCESNKTVALRDVIYIKTDSAALKFQYICTVCQKQWHT